MGNERNGCEQVEFELNGRKGIMICPKTAAFGKPWVWRAEFLHAFDYADNALLELGWHIAYYQLSDMFGCPSAVRQMETFREYIVDEFSLEPKAVLFGFSRGGLYAFNYAAAYPDRVTALYLDAPVLDIRSWPGGKGEGIGSPADWQACLAVYQITDEEADAFDQNPLDVAHHAAAAGIPIIVVAGDSDMVVPYRENGAVLERKYRELGGTIEVILIEGREHHPHSLEDPQPIVDFIKTARQKASLT
ncbi:alpha/beta fold hydrolase [Paenibacillus montanisoli]|uniref:Alpha/beta hydrolase n=1 Tax=Paenibacillus montanisoli TaxID=2081970 RepID=A0A328TYU1_9BACL|nr:alpha/beta fold hydrolase [Paenibacillus montanisoli]RAP75678.1 alpha/beta hydrolase [Paenibacillus montanisoli]